MVLLDFDGPICSVFAGRPADGVADRLRRRLGAAGVELPVELTGSRDPHALLAGLPRALRGQRVSEARIAQLTSRLDSWLSDEEWAAVTSAEETPGAWEAMAQLLISGHAVAVVSNNATVAVEEYLRRRKPVAESLEQRVFGRPSDPALMKPNPFLLRRALETLGAVEAGRAVLIGDAVTDAEAAARAGVEFIGFADGSERRRRRLLDAGVPDGLVVEGWSELGVSTPLQ